MWASSVVYLKASIREGEIRRTRPCLCRFRTGIDLAAIADLREWLIEHEAPVEDLVGMHEQALLTLRDRVSPENFAEIVGKTSTCLTELAMAYSLADQKKKSLRDREQRIARERQRLESLGQMAGGVAHEFNNLLQPIMGMTELAIEDAEAGTELAERLGVIWDCANKAAAVARGVLTVARKQGRAPRPAALTPLLRKAVQFLTAVLPREIGIDLSIDAGDDLVLCDEGELSQVLSNLVRNAGDAMARHGTVRIALRERLLQKVGPGSLGQPRALELTITDHGAGMSAEVAARVFQPFFTTKPATSGTGLGLPIALAIVQGWNGTLEIELGAGRGNACFDRAADRAAVACGQRGMSVVCGGAVSARPPISRERGTPRRNAFALEGE